MSAIANRLRKIEGLLAVDDDPAEDIIIEIVGIEAGTMARSWGVRRIREGGVVRQEYLDRNGDVVDEEVWLAGVDHPSAATNNRSYHYQSGGRE
jgi:hypothetical protein